MILDFNKIEKKHIRSLVGIKLNHANSDIDFIKKSYDYEAVHFEHNYQFLIQSNIINEEGGINDTYLQKLESIIQNDNQFIAFFLKILLSKKSTYSDYVSEYLRNFELKDDELIYQPFSEERIKYSGIRNLLSEFGLLRLGHNYTYHINAVHTKKILRIIKQSIVTPKKLKIIINDQNKIGQLAELRIVEYEKDRLKGLGINNDVEHVALENVALGYDIKSWETENNERYIEVKAVSKSDYKFHWSKNEIEISEKYGDKYFLYLLPVIDSKTFDIDSLLEIKNPHEVIFKEDSDYQKEPEQYLVWK